MPKTLTKLIITRDGRAKTSSGDEYEVEPVGIPFVLERIRNDYIPEDISKKLLRRQGFNAYCVGKPMNTKNVLESNSAGGHWYTDFSDFPIQLYDMKQQVFID